MFDWKIGLFILTLIGLIGNIATFAIIKFNDLRHLSKSVKDLTKEFGDFKKEFKKVSDKVITIDTRCGERHSL